MMCLDALFLIISKLTDGFSESPPLDDEISAEIDWVTVFRFQGKSTKLNTSFTST
jgi:hypothetical protein